MLFLVVIMAVLAAGVITALRILSRMIMLGLWVVILMVLAGLFFNGRLGLRHGMGGMAARGHSMVHTMHGGR